MRGAVTVVAWFVAVAAGLVAALGAWSATHLEDPSGFADLSTVVVEDDRVREATGRAAGDELVARTRLPDAVGGYVSRALDASLDEVLGTPEGLDAWRAALTSSHAMALAEPGRPLVLDLRPLAQLGLDRLTGQVPVDLRVPQDLTVALAGGPPTPAVEAVAQSTTIRNAALLVTVIAALAVLVAARRRALALAALGLGAVAVGGLVWLVARDLVPAWVDRATSADALASTFGSVLAGVATDSLTEVALTIGGAGVMVVAVGLSAWGAVRGRRRESTSSSRSSSPAP